MLSQFSPFHDLVPYAQCHRSRLLTSGAAMGEPGFREKEGHRRLRVPLSYTFL